MARAGTSIREANKRHSVQIMEASFESSQTARKVIVDEQEIDARIISDSKTTARGGNGNYVIQFRQGVNLGAGTYVQIPNEHGTYDWWLIMYESDSALFPKHLIKKCNYLLKWKNKKGEIIERWCVFNDNNKLMGGERKSGFNKITLSMYDTPLILPCDSETINIRLDRRFLVDHENVEDNPDAWIVTNRNVISKRFDTYNGVVELALSRHQFNSSTDNKELMIADYYQISETIDEVNPDIAADCRIVYSGDSNLKMDTPYKTYSAEIYLNGELAADIIPDWEIIIPDGNEEFFDYNIDGNQLSIKCKFDGLLRGSFIRIIAKNDTYGCSAELPVKVVSAI